MSAESEVGRIGVWGASGSGKSSYVKQRLAGRRRVVVFDPLAEYDMPECRSREAVRRVMRRNWRGFRVRYVPPVGGEALALSRLSRLMMESQAPYKAGAQRLVMTLVVEEMNLSFPVNGGAARSPGFAEICSRGRHYGIEIIGVSQRMAEVDTRFRGNCTETIVFRQKVKRDRDAGVDELGVSPAQLPRSNLEYVREAGGNIERGKVTFGGRSGANTNSPPRKSKAG